MSEMRASIERALRRRARISAWFGVALAVAACAELPSGVPLANSGGVLEDTGTDRDRHSLAASVSQSVAVTPERASATAASKPAVSSTSEAAAADAGAPVLPDGDAAPASTHWAGDYYGSDKLVRHFEGDPDDVELDDKAHTRVEENKSGALVISIVNSATGDTICALRATAHGSDASFDPGQSCFGDDGATSRLSEGHASLSAERLSLDFKGDVSEEADDDGDSLEFHLEYSFEGNRR
jgi:hypothetical protein